MKTNSDGSESPYELNVTYLDMLLTETDSGQPSIDRFMTSQAVMLSLKGIPGIYFHSLFGTQNDVAAVKETGIPRRINRRKFDLEEINNRLADKSYLPARILDRYERLLRIRKSQPAFHPDASQNVLALTNASILGFQREHLPTGQVLTVLANFSLRPQEIHVAELGDFLEFHDLISGMEFKDETIMIASGGVLWLLHQPTTNESTPRELTKET
jgi:sucrose phosphorylase